MYNRRKFIGNSVMTGLALWLRPDFQLNEPNPEVMTVNGPIAPAQMKFTLEHEYVLADFIGAKEYSRDRYNAEEVFQWALPFLKDVKSRGCTTFIDCSPAYLGRDVLLLKRLSDASGLQIITNTGYYGAVNEKFLPPQAFTESSAQIADRWISEWLQGIEGTGIKPGFIKTSVDKAPLTPAQEKMVEAAAITHLATGLTIAIHTGDGKASMEELRIIESKGVSPEARIWVHAQNEKDMQFHFEAAKRKSWVSFDGVNPKTIKEFVDFLTRMKTEKLLDQVLVSQDSGWYRVGEPNGGEYNDYNTVFLEFIPALKEAGFTDLEIQTLFVVNPQKAFTIRVRKR